MSGAGESRRGQEDLPELPVPDLPGAPGDATVAGLLGERYQVLGRLGTGAFGEVYRAHDRVLAREVAIKRIRLEAFSEPAQREDVARRFLREAQVAAQLRHPNIVTTHDIVSTPRSSFIVMELVTGRTLQSLIAERGRLALAETISILEQVAAALDHAHARKIVHRDVKPANIMIEPSGHVKVMDFGIAKAESGGDLTATGLIMGTPNYMSPEQARGGQVEARADIFSLGCVLYECLSGVRPFQADTVTAILVRILAEEPPPIDFAAASLPRSLGAVLGRAMAKDPDARFGSASGLVQALRASQRDAAADGGPPRGGTKAAPFGRRALRHPALVLAAAAAVATSCMAALIWIATDPYEKARAPRRGELVVEQPRGLVDRLLRRRPRLRVTLPKGTPLRLELRTPLSSGTAAGGQAVEARTTAPVRIEGTLAVPRGSRVSGRVTHALAAESAGGRGELALVFESLEIDGEIASLRTRPLAMRAPPPRRAAAEKKKGGLLDAVGGLIDRIKGDSEGDVDGGSAGTVAESSASGREVTLPLDAPLSVELAEPATLTRPAP